MNNMSYICKKCGNELTDDALFCSRCGEKVTITAPKCPNCGRELSEYAKFCAFCGTKICGDSQPLSEQSSEHTAEQPEGALLPDFEPAVEEQTDHSKDIIDSQSKSTQRLDIYKQLKSYEQAGKDNTVEYHELLKKEKKAYFWNKLIGFIAAIMACCLVPILFGEGGIGIKSLKVTVLGFAFAIPMFLCSSRIQKLTGIKVGISLSSLFANKTKDEETAEEKEIDAGMDYFTRCVKGRHPGADRTVRILMVVATVIAIVCFAICIGAEINFWESLQLALMLLYSIAAVIYGIWTFKFAIILILLAIGAILSLFSDDKGISSYPINTETSQPVSSQAEDTCVTISGARLDEYNGKEAIVVSYSWTNTTNSKTSAIYNVAIHAYQNDIELEKAYFTDADDELLSRNIKPGVTVDLEEAFYLDDPDADILVEATPWIALNGEVYISETFTRSTEQASESDNDRSSWEYDDYVRYYGVDPADYGYMWYNEIRSGPLDEFFEYAVEAIYGESNTSTSRLYDISNPYEANLTPDDFIGTWRTDGGIIFTIQYTDGEYSIDLSENEGLGILGGWFSEKLYNVEGTFCGLAGSNGVTEFSVSYEYGSEPPINSWLTLILVDSAGQEIYDYVPLISN